MSYFKPLRRKIGVMTLIMAGVFMAGWARSLLLSDNVRIQFGFFSDDEFNSSRGQLSWTLGRPSLRQMASLVSWPRVKWVCFPFDTKHRLTNETDEGVICCVPALGFAIICQSATISSHGIPVTVVSSLVIIHPYWAIVVPLTLLSAYLLLSKPRLAKRVEPPITTAN